MHLDVENFEPPWGHPSKTERKKIDRHFGTRRGQNHAAGGFLNRQIVDAQRRRIAVHHERGSAETEFVAMAETIVECLGDLRRETVDRDRPEREAGNEETAAGEREKNQPEHELARGPRMPRGAAPACPQPDAWSGTRRFPKPAQPISRPRAGPGRIFLTMSGQPLAAFQNQAEAGNFDPVRLYAFYPHAAQTGERLDSPIAVPRDERKAP